MGRRIRVHVRDRFRGPGALDERVIHRLFVASLWLKGALALIEILGGIAAYFVTQSYLVGLANAITQGELKEDPHDLVAGYLLHAAQSLSVSTQHFVAVYLFGHGAIKLWLIVGLLRRRLWYYPTAMIIFGLFIAYQLYRFYFTHSAWLVAVTFVDAIVIALAWHEYRYIKRREHGGEGLDKPPANDQVR